jgi:hypothetical protein
LERNIAEAGKETERIKASALQAKQESDKEIALLNQQTTELSADAEKSRLAIVSAQADVAKANAASKDAVAKVAGAEARSAEASAKAEAFRLDIAKANESAKQAEARAAQANLELARLKTPRSLSAEQQERIVSRLTRFAHQRFSLNVYPDSESISLATLIDSMLKHAGWERVTSQSGDIVSTVAGETAGQISGDGVQAFIGEDNEAAIPALTSVASALSENGLPCSPYKTAQLNSKTLVAILLAIGKKPQNP